MRYASLIALISSVADGALVGYRRDRDISATPKNPSPVGRHGCTVATDRRRAKKARNQRRNRSAHRGKR